MYIIVLESNFQSPAYLVVDGEEDYYFSSTSTDATEFADVDVDVDVARFNALHPEYNFVKRKCTK